MRPLPWLCLLLALTACTSQPVAQTSAPTAVRKPLAERPPRFAEEIAKFEAKDKVSPPPQHAVVLYGSSTLRLWGDRAAVALKPYPIVNRGFGGAYTTEAVAYEDRAVLRYRPRVVIFHCGSNDIAAGDPAEAVVGRVRAFVARLRQDNPDCAIILTANTRAPARRKVWAEMEKSNDGLREIARFTKGVTFMDTNAALTQPDGEPKPGHFLKDGVHPSELGYQSITALLRPALEAAWKSNAGAYNQK